MRLALAPAIALMASLAAAPVLAEGLADMSDAERAAFREEVKAYLLENPEVIVEAMTVLQSREDEAAYQRDIETLSSNSDRIYNSPDDWAGGNLDGDVVLVEFMDYTCSWCQKAAKDLDGMVETDGNIRFVVKEFPVRGPEAVLLSKFAIAVRLLHGDDAYKAAHDALFSLRGNPDEATLARLAVDLGHDPDAIALKMQDPEVQAIIDANYKLATLLELTGTPAFVIGQTMVRGYVPVESMLQIVEGQRNDG